ncbi:MAG: RNA polymerase sigma-70 factor [Solirubrobacteraceae bacterium]
MTQTQAFDQLQGLMFSIAYRMTGSVGDAEDIVQDAFVRLERARREGVEVESPKAWLSSVTTRLAIDQLRSARMRRERYVGPWLPEPLLTDPAPGPLEQAQTADSLSQAFLVVLETLSPVERAVFLLREVFGYEHAEIAAVVGKTEQNCRQLAARARQHVEARRPRFTVDRRAHEDLFERFLLACETGDADRLKEILAADALVYSDGGGKVVAARRPISGPDRIARFLTKITRTRRERGDQERRVSINGQPGLIVFGLDGTASDALTIDISDGMIDTVRIVRNPDKLRHLGAVADPAELHGP